MLIQYFVPLLMLLMASFAVAQTTQPADPIARFRELKYGMFIHFGMSTFTGREIDLGDQPSTTYAPTDLDVDQWIKVAHDAGMKYAVLTSKHVAGHCLWDSKVQFRGKEFDYDVATSGNKTDVVAAFVRACRKYDLMPGLYWCMLDFHNNSVPQKAQWTHADLPDDFFQLAQDQLTELIRNYPDINYYWLDIPRAASADQRTVLYNLIKKLRPQTVVLFNAGTGPPTGPVTIKQFSAAWPTDVLNSERHPMKPGQFKPELEFEGKTYSLAYEHCDCLASNWFWVKNDPPRSVSTLFRLHRQTIAAGGNLLLDVAPDRSGRIPSESITALQDLKKLIDDPAQFREPVTFNAKVSASNTWKNNKTYSPAAAVDGEPSTRWATDDGTTSAWLEVELDQPTLIGAAHIEQAFPELHRIQAYAIEYLADDVWKPCHQGKDMPATVDASFNPVTARKFRLHIIQATDGPTIFEFQLFAPK